jgi:uncharacterized membrane protein
MENENNTSNDIRAIKETIERMSQEIARQGERLYRLEEGAHRQTASDLFIKSVSEEKMQPVNVSSLPPLPPPPPPLAGVKHGEHVFSESVLNEKTVSESAHPSPKADTRDFEEKMGVTWFSRIGMVALIVGASYFLKYAFDNNWIGPTGRVLIGIVAGLAIIALGGKLIKKYFAYGQLIMGGGISILYLSLYSALNFYHLITPSVAFAFMALVTTIGAILSVRYNALPLMIFSTLGGFVTPMLVSTGTNQQIALFSYILLLDLAVFGVSFFKRWHAVQFLGFLGTLFMFSGWMNEFYTAPQIGSTFLFATLFFFVYSVSALAYNLVRKEISVGGEQALALLSGVVYFATSYEILNDKYHAFMGFFALLLAIYYFLWANICKKATPKDALLYNFLAFLSVGFITLAIPIQFKSNVITLSWFVEAVLLTYAGISSKNYILKQFAVVVTVLPIARLLFLDYDMARTGTALLNERFFTYLFGVVALFLIGYLWRQDTESNDSKKLAVIAIVAANFFALMAGSLEISYYYENARSVISSKTMWVQDIQLSKTYGNNQALQTLQIFNIKEGIALSFYWLLYAIILLTIGISGKLKHLRLFGFILLVGALFKFTVADAWRVGDLQILERFGVYGFIIGILYGAAYVWSKFEENPTQAKKLVAVFAVFANLFTLYAGSMEISYYYNDFVKVENAKISQNYQNNYAGGGGSQNYNATAEYKQIEKLNNKESVTLSIFWIFYAVFLLTLGIIKKARYIRLFGLFLLSFAIIKLFIYDLWGLGTLYRIISSMTLGVVLLSVSYAYQRFKDQIKTII